MTMLGTNLYTDGHFDKYVLTFYDYQVCGLFLLHAVRVHA